MEPEGAEKKEILKTVNRIKKRSQQYYSGELFLEKFKDDDGVEGVSIFVSSEHWWNSDREIFKVKFFYDHLYEEKEVLCKHDSLIRLVVEEEMRIYAKKFGKKMKFYEL